MALDVLERDLAPVARGGIDRLGAIGESEVLACSEGSRDNVSRVGGVIADADSRPRGDMELG
eukprot:5399505-Alexandrium_andersonii.AAC.1